MSSIHATAIVEPGAKLADDVRIGPYCVIGAEVELAEQVELVSHVVIAGRTRIGAGTKIYSFASLGGPPQDLKYKGEPSALIIGAKNVIREQVTMNPGTAGGGMVTRVGNNGLFMVGAHVAHDCKLGNNVIMANNATLGGHVEVGDHAILGGLCAVHQFVRIGPHAMIGGMSGVEHDVIPYGLVKGDRARLSGLNYGGPQAPRLLAQGHPRSAHGLSSALRRGRHDGGAHRGCGAALWREPAGDGSGGVHPRRFQPRHLPAQSGSCRLSWGSWRAAARCRPRSSLPAAPRARLFRHRIFGHDGSGDGARRTACLGQARRGRRFLAALRKEGVEELVFAGPVKRPTLNHFNLDMSALKMLAKIGPRAFFGDDGLLAGIVRELEREGFRVLAVNDVLGGPRPAAWTLRAP